ncbi:MAG: hypothetical protein ABIQ49_15685, partial [Gemmatimonadales bacterium]
VWSSEALPAEPLRTVDLFPAMLDWLGVPPPEGLDGEAVWRPGERWRRAQGERGAPTSPPRVRTMV